MASETVNPCRCAAARPIPERRVGVALEATYEISFAEPVTNARQMAAKEPRAIARKIGIDLNAIIDRIDHGHEALSAICPSLVPGARPLSPDRVQASPAQWF